MPGITQTAESFVKSVVNLMTRAGVEEERIELMRPELSEMVEDYTHRMSKMEQEQAKMEQEQAYQKELITKLVQRIGFLERQMKKATMAERRRDYNLVKGNLIVRTKKSIPEVKKFLTNAVELGGGPKMTQNSLPVVEIPPAPGKTREVKILRVALGDGLKASLFKGLSRAALGPEESTIRVDHEVPFYLIQTKREMERIAYSLRQKFKASLDVKTKIVFSNYKLRLRVRDRNNPSWVNLDDAKASTYMEAQVLFKPEEVPEGGIPTVRQFYTKTLEALD